MANPRRYVFNILTSAGGGATVTPAQPNVSQPVRGHVKAVLYLPGSTPMANNATLTLTSKNAADGAVQTILNAAVVTTGAQAQQWAPRQPTHTAAGAAALYAAAGTAVNDDFVLADEDLTLVVAAGGATANGTVVVIVE